MRTDKNWRQSNLEKKPRHPKKQEAVKAQKSAEKTAENPSMGKRAPSRRPMWTGSVTIGLINVPVKLYPMIYDRGVSFHFLHKTDNHPLRYQKICTKDNAVVPWSEVAKGYEVSKGQYVVFGQEELDAVKPESDKRIRISKFVDYFSVDPVYFSSTYALMPDKSGDAYSLLLQVLEKMGKAAAGRITLRTKEYPALVHAYKGALVLTTLRYGYDVVDPSGFEELGELTAPEKAELELAKKIITDLSGEFDINEYKDTYREKVEALIQKKLKGETITVEKPPKEEIKGLMAALQETLKQLEKK
ncbi:MAG: Ku protein [Candidatus Bathyarchaeota archaeon]|nr:Ku protein [Candidatus Bathyarchaeota archaeon]